MEIVTSTDWHESGRHVGGDGGGHDVRSMGHLTDGERARTLDLNAARIWKFQIPERYLNHDDAPAVAEQVRSEKRCRRLY